MRRFFGIIFTLALVLTPITFFKVKADNTDSPTETSTTTTSTPVVATNTIVATGTAVTSVSAPKVQEPTKNPLLLLKRALLKRLENNAHEAKVNNPVPEKSVFSMFQKKFEDFLNILNNTGS